MSLNVSVIERGTHGSQANGLGRWLVRRAPKSARGEVTVAIVPDARMKALNKQFRGKNEVTDVLSFPSQTGERAKGSSFLGEIVIARGLARTHARALGHTVAIELRILALHGLLHLLGYDHEMDDGQMARVEGRLRRRAGLPEGLIARSS